MELTPGLLVTDNVRLVSLLGTGGMGSVWVADHLSLKTRVAVKFLSAELVRQDANILERFNREAAMSAKIKSPHVVQTFDHGVMEDGRPYIVMELLEGESLAERLLRTRIIALADTKNIVAQTAKALAKAHKLGVIHRDIKPDNLFLSYDDDELHLKVLDFGIAKQTGLPKASAVTGTGMMVGTPEYMSPEQVLSAKSVDARSDLWALGVVAYHCLTGGVPFTGETLGSLCVAIANGRFVPPTQHRPELPQAIDAWFLRALAKEPGDRFVSAKELATTFHQALGAFGMDDTLSITTQPTGTAEWSGKLLAVSQTPEPAPSGTPAPGQGSFPSGPGLAARAHTPNLGPSPDSPEGASRVVSPTFAGATMTPAPARGRRVAVLVGATLAALVVASAAAVVALRQDAGPTTSAATEQPSVGTKPDAPTEVPSAASAGASVGDAPHSGGRGDVAPTDTASASAMSSTKASAAVTEPKPSGKLVPAPRPLIVRDLPEPRGTPAPGPRGTPAPKPQPKVKPQPKSKDRGF